MTGRRPKPTHLKVLAGNPGHRPLNRQEPQPQLAAPPCPSHLDREAKREWKRLVPELLELGLLSRIDGAALAAYCQSYSRWAAAERELKKQGLVVVTATGRMVRHPLLQIAEHAASQMRHWLQEFGLTPASRARLQTQPTPPESAEAQRERRFFD